MSNKQYILSGLDGDLAIHFAKAVDGSDSVSLSPITETSFGTPNTALKIFNSEDQAAAYKDKLCIDAASMFVYTPYTLETYCNLEVKPFERALEVV